MDGGGVLPGIRYIRIASKFWQDEKVKELSDDARVLYLYILTSPHSNMIGYYILPKPYVAYDLNWSMERLEKPFAELLRMGLIKYCEQSDIVLVPNFLKYNTIQNSNQAKGAVNRLSMLPANSLVDDFITVAKRFAEPFVEQLSEGLPERYSNTVSVSVTGSVSVTASASEAQAPAEKPDDDAVEPNRNNELIKHFAQAFGAPPNQAQVEMLLSFLDDGIPEELIFEALKRSAEAGANSPRYTAAILQSWVSKSAFTLDDVRALDNLRQPRRASGPVAREDFTYTTPQQDLSFFTFLDDDPEDNNDKIKEIKEDPA